MYRTVTKVYRFEPNREFCEPLHPHTMSCSVKPHFGRMGWYYY